MSTDPNVPGRPRDGSRPPESAQAAPTPYAQPAPPPPPPQDPYAQAYGYPQPQYGYGQPAYPGYGAPYGYPQPAYGYPYAPPYGYPPPVEEKSGYGAVAGVMWILLFIRHTIVLIFMIVFGALLAFLDPSLNLTGAFVIFPLIGMAGCVMAAVSGFSNKNHTAGAIGGVMALIGCFPGIFFVGVVGLILGLIGLALHLVSRPQFES